jgi:hypothetical protein
MVECISTPFDLFHSSLALNPANHQRGRNKGFLLVGKRQDIHSCSSNGYGLAMSRWGQTEKAAQQELPWIDQTTQVHKSPEILPPAQTDTSDEAFDSSHPKATIQGPATRVRWSPFRSDVLKSNKVINVLSSQKTDHFLISSVIFMGFGTMAAHNFFRALGVSRPAECALAYNYLQVFIYMVALYRAGLLREED